MIMGLRREEETGKLTRPRIPKKKKKKKNCKKAGAEEKGKNGKEAGREGGLRER